MYGQDHLCHFHSDIIRRLRKQILNQKEKKLKGETHAVSRSVINEDQPNRPMRISEGSLRFPNAN